MSRIGLVLEGGGMRGIYTAGVLDVMIEKGFHPDVICGTSAGVTFGVNLPSRQKGRVLRYNLACVGRRDYISFHSLLTTGNIINVPFAYDKLPRQIDVFDNEAFNSSGTEFWATVTNTETGKAEYMQIRDCDAQMDVIRASASLPFLSRKVMIDGVPYLDGGIADNIPLEKCLELGCDRIILVLTHPADFVRTGSMVPLARLFYPRDRHLIQAMAERSDRYNECLRKIARLRDEGKVIVIQPQSPLRIGRLEKDRDKIRQTHALGVQDAEALWDRIEAYLNA